MWKMTWILNPLHTFAFEVVLNHKVVFIVNCRLEKNIKTLQVRGFWWHKVLGVFSFAYFLYCFNSFHIMIKESTSLITTHGEFY